MACCVLNIEENDPDTAFIILVERLRYADMNRVFSFLFFLFFFFSFFLFGNHGS